MSKKDISHRASYWNNQTLGDLFPGDKIWVLAALEKFQNNPKPHSIESTMQLQKRGEFSQNNLFLPIRDLMIEKDIVGDWLIPGASEASAHALSSGAFGGPPRPSRARELGFSLAFSPSRRGEAAKNRKNWLPTGKERKRREG